MLCTIPTKRYISLYGHLLNLNQFNPNMAGLFEGIVFSGGGSPFHPLISRRTNLILIKLYTTIKYPIYNRFKIRPIIVNFSFIVISCTRSSMRHVVLIWLFDKTFEDFVFSSETLSTTVIVSIIQKRLYYIRRL